MDESLSLRGTVKRLALLTALNCAVTCVADSPAPLEQQEAAQASANDLRALLSRGWDPGSAEASQLPPLPEPDVAPHELPVEGPVATIVRPKPKPLLVTQPESSSNLERLEQETEPQRVPLSDLLKNAPSLPSQRKSTPAPAKVVSLPSDLVDQSLELPSLKSRKRELLAAVAQHDGFGLLAIDQIAPPEVQEENPAKRSTAVIHANRLQEMSRQMLKESASALRRGAVFTARKKATSALRSVIAMRDSETGGNQYARQLETAQSAIRESRDFGLGMQLMKTDALQRLVDIHDTVALKDQSLSEVSPLHATESYLACAKENLVGACGSVSEASYALTLLGSIEQRAGKATNPHALAIALTYQRAAVQIDPTNAYAHYEMGKTLLDQGLVQEAREALLQSVQLSPNRGSYQKLLVAARKLGDIDTVRRCSLALTDESLPSEIPVLQLSMTDFAAMHRPPAHRIAQSNLTSPEVSARHVTQSSKSASQARTKSSSRMSKLRSWFSADK